MIGTLVVTFLALVFLGIAGWQIRAERARKRWPWVQGVVRAGRIRRKTSGVGDDESTSFVPVVEYAYQVGPQSFVGSGVSWSEVAYGSVKSVEKVLARYPAGKVVEVHYNPQRPEQAFLESGGILGWIFLAVGLVLLATGAVLGVAGV